MATETVASDDDDSSSNQVDCAGLARRRPRSRESAVSVRVSRRRRVLAGPFRAAAARRAVGRASRVPRSRRTCTDAGKGKGKGKWSIAVRKTPHRYGNSRAIWDHTVLPATQQR